MSTATLPVRRHRRPPRRLIAYTVLAVLAAFSAGPLVVLASNSLKSNAEQGTNPLGIPLHPRFSNFTDAWSQGDLATTMRNSAMITLGTVIGVVVLAGLASHALARLDMRGGGAFVGYLLFVTAIPAQLFVVPLFFLWVRVGLYDTIPGLILIYIGVQTPLATLLLRSFMLAVPRDFDDAARIDGASELAVFLRVVVPLARPGLLTIALVAGLAAWNEFFFAVTFIQDQSRMPVVTSFLAFQSQFTRDWGLTSAAALLIATPVLLLFLALQRHFVAGLSGTGSGLRG